MMRAAFLALALTGCASQGVSPGYALASGFALGVLVTGIGLLLIEGITRRT